MAHGIPDLRQFTESPETYLEMHQAAIRDHDFGNRTTASWGLIAKGRESLPILVRLLQATSPESREDAAGALGWLGESDPAIVSALCDALADAETDEERDSLVVALGALRSVAAIPQLAALIRDDATDGDTCWTAIQALGRIVRRRFDRQSDPQAAAVAWLDAHPD